MNAVAVLTNEEVVVSSLPLDKPRISYCFADGRHELRLDIDTHTQSQLEEIFTAPVQLALVIEREFLVFLCQFGTQPWKMTPFQWHRLPREQRTTQPNGWEPVVLEVTVVDAQNGQLYGERTLQLGPEFTASLCGSILLQVSRPWAGEATYQQAWDALIKKYPSAQKLLPHATARTLIFP